MNSEIQTVPVNLAGRGYPIHAAPGLLAEVGSLVAEGLNPSSAAIITDATVSSIYGQTAQKSLEASGIASTAITFPAGEDSKKLSQLSALYDQLFSARLDRKSVIIALGGGVTGDLAGFAAATFLRGIRFVQVPTTLLAMVDSSSGGKTGVNHPTGKNLIGAFHQPSLVLIDPATLKSLPPEELASGMAEVVKHGMIRDAQYFALIESSINEIINLDMDLLTNIILGSCRIKGSVVEIDERETGIRAILNFGHTFGHAYEALSNFSIRHGEAVAIGMVAACHLAQKLGLCEYIDRLEPVLTQLGLPTSAPAYPVGDILSTMRGDKKTEHGNLRFVLPRSVGEVDIFSVDDESLIVEALQEVTGS